MTKLVGIGDVGRTKRSCLATKLSYISMLPLRKALNLRSLGEDSAISELQIGVDKKHLVNGASLYSKLYYSTVQYSIA